MENNDATISEQQQLVSDMKSVIADAEDMLHATADQAGEKVASLRARIQDRLQGARARLRVRRHESRHDHGKSLQSQGADHEHEPRCQHCLPGQRSALLPVSVCWSA